MSFSPSRSQGGFEGILVSYQNILSAITDFMCLKEIMPRHNYAKLELVVMPE
jgi:hypothetical protein